MVIHVMFLNNIVSQLENKLKKKVYDKSIFMQDIFVGIWYAASSKGKNVFNTTIIY